MTLPINLGPITRFCTREENGHRTYTVNWHIRTASVFDGPAYILANWPMPAVGDPYNLSTWYPGDSDVDLWAFCTPELNIAPHRDVREGDPHFNWVVTQKFTTSPTWRCNTFPVENPLLEPFHYTGDFRHEQREASVDRFGMPLVHPNFEPIKGPQVEQKISYPNINITFNSATLPLSTYVLLVNKVNDRELWDLPPRTIRFVDAKWERLVYGTCFYYFRTTYSFEINLDTFDLPIPAVGTKVLARDGSALNPDDYVQYKDSNGENSIAPLDVFGRAITRPEDQFIQRPEISPQGNLLLLGIPNDL